MEKINYSSYALRLHSFQNQIGFENLKSEFLEKLGKISADGIVIVGMGGSGAAARLIQGSCEVLRLPFDIHISKFPKISAHPFKRPFFIFVSFSGETKEVLEAYNSTKEPKAIVSGGGKLLALALQNKIPYVSYTTKELTARECLGYNYYSIIKVLSSLKGISPTLSLPSINTKSIENLGESIANKIKNKKTVLIYTEEPFLHIGYIWKIVLNETAKQNAFLGSFPEISHNEIEALQTNGKEVAIVWIGNSKNKIVQKKRTGIISVLKTKKIDSVIIPFSGKTEEEQMWKSVLLAHFTSLSLAKLKHVKPEETPFINQLKVKGAL